MPNKRDLRLDKYGISKYKYRELYNFCLQYNEKKQQLSTLRGLSAVSIDAMPKADNTSSPTEKQALKAIEIQKDIELIEQTAIDADSGIYQYILKCVTENLHYEELMVPCGRRYFYEARRRFYYLLSQKR